LPRSLCTTDAVLRATPDGVRVAIRLTPRANADRIIGVANGALTVTVTAPPAENRANDALLRLLAREWRIPRRDLTVITGAKSRDKTILIRSDTGSLLERLVPLLPVSAPAQR
jgi:uncharacterized protein